MKWILSTTCKIYNYFFWHFSGVFFHFIYSEIFWSFFYLTPELSKKDEHCQNCSIFKDISSIPCIFLLFSFQLPPFPSTNSIFSNPFSLVPQPLNISHIFNLQVFLIISLKSIFSHKFYYFPPFYKTLVYKNAILINCLNSRHKQQK